jgi:hypothetical protein
VSARSGLWTGFFELDQITIHPAKPLFLPDPVPEEQAFRRSITENGYAMFDGKVGMNGVHRCIQSAIESNIAFLARPERDATTVEWLRLSLEAA